MAKLIKMHSKLSNTEVVVIAAYLAGAGRVRTDTEDIAIKANGIAPGRFTWRKYPEQIDIDTVRKRLWDACKKDKGYLIGSERGGWLLTAEGLLFAKRHRKFTNVVPQSRASLNERRWRGLERKRLLATAAYLKYNSGESSSITVREAQGFFRIDSYSDQRMEEEKVVRLVNAFGRDRTIGPVLQYLISVMKGVSWQQKPSLSKVT